jgi:hypothetical protein
LKSCVHNKNCYPERTVIPIFLFLSLKEAFMKTIQFREAIQGTMSEIGETVYLMGEEVAEYNGTSTSKGMLDEFSAKRVIILSPELGLLVAMGGCRPVGRPCSRG